MKTLAMVVLVVLSLTGCRSRPRSLEVPPQFADLKTDTNDFTCAGTQPCATWITPPMPASGESVADPGYGTTTYRLTSYNNNPVMPAYSRVQAWNSDSTRMMMVELPSTGGIYLDLYDATTTPPTFINRISPSDGLGIDPASSDGLWAYTDPHRIYYNVASSTGHGLELRYVDIGGCTKDSCAPTPQIVHTFSCVTDATSTLGAGVVGNKIETGSGGQGGMFDSTDTYFSFTCDKVASTGRHEIDFIRYNRATDTVEYQDKWYKACPGQTPSGCKAYQVVGRDASLIRMNQHPDRRFITVIWQTNTAACPALDSKWVRSCGTEVFDEHYNFLGPASPSNTHQDTGYDIHGDPVLVAAGYKTGYADDYREWAITNLTHLDPAKVIATHILVPPTFSYVGSVYVGFQKPWHVSMQAWHLPGWALLSTFMYAGPSLNLAAKLPAPTQLGTAVSQPGTVTVTPASMATIAPTVLSLVDFGSPNAEFVTWSATTVTTATATFAKTHSATAPVQAISPDNTGWGAGEMWAMKIDDQQTDMSDAIFYRIGRTHAMREGNYNCEAHATVNRDFTQIVWGSSWDVACNSNAQLASYWMPLNSKAPIPPNPDTCVCVEQTVSRWAWRVILFVVLMVLILVGAGWWLLRKKV